LPSFRLRCRRALTSHQSAVLRFSRAAILAGPLPVCVVDKSMHHSAAAAAQLLLLAVDWSTKIWHGPSQQ
jgi:hypothetical protein